MIRELGKDPGEPGEDVYLTIDRQVQALADQKCGDESAAMVVMDCNNGDIIALSSTPGFDPNWFNVGLTNPQWHDLTTSDHKPLLNKVTSGIYPPGSTFKTAVALAAIESGLATPDYRVTCNGRITVGNHTFNCWAWTTYHRGHGSQDVEGGIKNSCDVFFYETARRLGIDPIEQSARKLGLGSVTGIELPGEHSGLIPSRAWKQKTYKQPWQPGDTLSVGIGQGYVTATPLQLVQQAARLASGKAVSPRLVHSVGGKLVPRPEVAKLDFTDEALARVRNGMNRTMNEGGGTAYSWRITAAGLRNGGQDRHRPGARLFQGGACARHHQEQRPGLEAARPRLVHRLCPGDRSQICHRQHHRAWRDHRPSPCRQCARCHAVLPAARSRQAAGRLSADQFRQRGAAGIER